MAKLPDDHPMSAHKDIVGQTMHRWKHHDPKPLHSGVGKGGKEGKVVKSQDQAIAIALSMAGESKSDGKGRKGKKSSKSSDHSERLTSLGYSEETAHTVSDMLSSLDFARCQRPDGSHYGTAGQCRKGVEKALSVQEKLDDLYKREAKARNEGDTETARKLMREHMNLSKQLDSSTPAKSKKKAKEVRAQAKMKEIQAETNPQRQKRLIRELDEINNPLVKLPDGRVSREWGLKSPYEI